ncbi:MAG TPA: exosortase system-associated protein, TIGR04073 family [Haliangiales bacterium]|nr:exosortase system-associated protein, TIGR04073 family [Haliangiales bacterium]
MRNSLTLLATTAVLAIFASGCASTDQGFAFERKFGRGLRNATEFARGGEIRRSMEQTGLLDGPDMAYTTGFIRGFNRSLARTGIGIYEMVTAPFPSYEPIGTSYLSVDPVYPDSYKPHLLADPTFGPDTALGFSGGDVAPIFPGSRFRIFDN